MKKVVTVIFALIIGFVGGLFLTAIETDTSGDPENLAEISHRDLENNTVYYVEELVVLDTFATMDDDILYMSVMFEDEEGDYTILNMPVNEDDEIWDDVNAYMDDDSLGYGDLVLDGYVQTETNVNVENKLYGFFEDWITQFEDQTDLSVAVTTSLRFDYICDKDGDPYAIIKGANIVGKVMGVLTIAVAALVLYFGALRKPKPKPVTTYTIPSYAPQQNAYSAPTYGAPQQPQYSMSGADPVTEQLNRYKALVDAGVMSDEEFERKRRELQGL